MPRSLPLSVREEINAEAATDEPIVLVEITPPEGGELVRLSSHPTQVLSGDVNVPPIIYGTVHTGFDYPFVWMNALVPDDAEQPSPSSLVFENVSSDMTAIVRSTTAPATVRLKLVFSSDPNLVIAEFADLKTTRAVYDANRITIDISRESILAEPWPAHRMTQTRFPGLFR